MASPNRNITDISASQSQKEVTHNEAVHNLDVGQETDFIINGSMAVQQRAGPFTALGANALEYSLDMMAVMTQGSPQARATITQENASFTGFAKGLKIDCTTAEAAVASTELWAFQTRIMASKLRGLDYGGTPKDLALTFTIKSPKSGTHCVALYQPDGTRRYIREFTVATADTQETFTIVFPGDASGTIDDNNAEGLRLTWPLVAGSDFHGTKDAWAAGEDYATSNQQNLLDSTANNFEITGLSLRTGSVNTGNVFIARPIEDERRLCKGHYRLAGLGLTGLWDTAAQCYLGGQLAPEMNGVPTVTLLDTTPTVRHAGGDLAGTSSTKVSSVEAVAGFLALVDGFTGATVGDGAAVNQTADVFELVYNL